MSAEVRLAVLEEQMRALRAEIALQGKEYERRLSELNHAHDKQVHDQSTYISDDKFSGWQGEISTWRNSVNKTLAVLEGRSGGLGSAWQLVSQFLPWIIAIAAIFWRR